MLDLLNIFFISSKWFLLKILLEKGVISKSFYNIISVLCFFKWNVVKKRFVCYIIRIIFTDK